MNKGKIFVIMDNNSTKHWFTISKKNENKQYLW